MKKITLIIIISSMAMLFPSAKGQGYIPFPDSGATWVNTYYTHDGGPWNPFPTSTLVSVTNYCSSGEDTLIHANVYFKIDTCGAGYKGGIRDDNGKVYFIPRKDTSEYLLYDFTIQKGDTVKQFYSEDESGYPYFQDYVFNFIDTVNINGQDRKRIHTEAGYWIEGIGNTLGLFKESFINVSNYGVELHCMSYDDTTLYPNVGPGVCSLTVGVEEKALSDAGILVYPNPFHNKFNLDLPMEGLKYIEVYDINSRMVFCTKKYGNNISINLENNRPGMYLLKIRTEKQTVVRKLMKR